LPTCEFASPDAVLTHIAYPPFLRKGTLRRTKIFHVLTHVFVLVAGT